MKKSALIMLLVLALSFSTMLAAESLDGHSYSLENILILTAVENQVVSAPVSEVESVLSDQFIEQVNVTSIKLPADNGLELENIENVTTLTAFNLRPENYRGGGLHYAIYYQQIT